MVRPRGEAPQLAGGHAAGRRADPQLRAAAREPRGGPAAVSGPALAELKGLGRAVEWFDLSLGDLDGGSPSVGGIEDEFEAWWSAIVVEASAPAVPAGEELAIECLSPRALAGIRDIHFVRPGASWADLEDDDGQPDCQKALPPMPAFPFPAEGAVFQEDAAPAHPATAGAPPAEALPPAAGGRSRGLAAVDPLAWWRDAATPAQLQALWKRELWHASCRLEVVRLVFEYDAALADLAGSGASSAYPVQAGHADEHGHAKVHNVALDTFTGEKYEDLFPMSHIPEVPFVGGTQRQLLDANPADGGGGNLEGSRGSEPEAVPPKLMMAPWFWRQA